MKFSEKIKQGNTTIEREFEGELEDIVELYDFINENEKQSNTNGGDWFRYNI